ncbi:hypothetical protein PS6_011730 [Mucor atramentarius]
MQGRYIGDHDGKALRMIMDNNVKSSKANNKHEFEEYVGVMLDNNKAYKLSAPALLSGSEPFILSINNNQNISGYALQPTKPAQERTTQLTTLVPIKIMAYDDNDILIFVKSKPEYNMEIVMNQGQIKAPLCAIM